MSSTTATTTMSQTVSAAASSTSASSGTSTDASGQPYYYVFFALILCIVGLAGFTFFRRRRKMMRLPPGARPNAWNRPGVLVTPDNRWLGRWRAAETSREEGLNEFGEAPPAYVPKSDLETGQAGQQEMRRPEVAVPLQTLSRDAAGLKPPEYHEAVVESSALPTTSGSSRHPA